MADPSVLAESASLTQRATGIQRADDAALGLALAGGAALVTSVVLYLTEP